MTHILAVDPGLQTGAALGFYDATTPFTLLQRWQIPMGIQGWVDWKMTVGLHLGVDEIVYERFIFADDEPADYSGVPIEGSLEEWGIIHGIPVIQQDRTHKGRLTGYPPEAISKPQRQRVRFDFLERHGLYLPGTHQDDSNDAITHAIVSLRVRRHIPTMQRFWPRPPRQIAA